MEKLLKKRAFIIGLLGEIKIATAAVVCYGIGGNLMTYTCLLLLAFALSILILFSLPMSDAKGVDKGLILVGGFFIWSGLVGIFISIGSDFTPTDIKGGCFFR